MCAGDYIRSMVNANDVIYIDTASLMDVEYFDRFIQNAEDIFCQAQRRIIVPRAVCLELARHLGSRNSDKSEKAMRALELISAHEDMFDVKNENLREEEAFKAFADSELLAELTLNRADCGQLLITNDRRLSEDAYNLNLQSSCRGHKVMVCFINDLGELRKCECTRMKEESQIQSSNCVEKAGQDTSSNMLDQAENGETEDRHTLLNVLIPFGTFAAGFITCKYGRTAIKYISTLL